MNILSVLLLILSSSCALLAPGVQAFASDPNTVEHVEALVETVHGLVDRAIDHAEAGALKSLVPGVDGEEEEHDIATELHGVKDALHGVALPNKRKR